MLNVWLDTDIGGDIDDAVALLCAVRHPEINLVGVSTVYGRVDARAWLVREMLDRSNRPDIPVFPGSAMPLAGEWSPSDAGCYGGLAPALPPLSGSDDERMDAIAAAMAALPEPFHLVTIGALTNAARLLDRHAGLAERWQSVTCMAGRLEGSAEYNVACDPLAARQVARRLRPRLVGLEASSNTLDRLEVEALVDPSDPASAFLLDCYRKYREAVRPDDPDRAPLTLFDPISLLSLVRPQAFDLQSVRVLVEKDGRLRLTDDGAPVEYALSSDWPALKPLIAALLRGDQL
jgi:inosine-uridine nucleoside N-ribohydrolase